MAQVKKFTLAQVKEHRAESDLWIVIRDKVYDVTKFLKEVCMNRNKCQCVAHAHKPVRFNFVSFIDFFQHPGGEDVLKEVAGKDATKDFDDVGHSDSAM